MSEKYRFKANRVQILNRPVLRPNRRVSFSDCFANDSYGDEEPRSKTGQHSHNTRSGNRSARFKPSTASLRQNTNNSIYVEKDVDISSSRKVDSCTTRTSLTCKVNAPRVLFMAKNNIKPFNIFMTTRGSNMLLLPAAKDDRSREHLLLHTGGDKLTELFVNCFTNEASQLEGVPNMDQAVSLCGTQLQQLLPMKMGKKDDNGYNFLAVFENVVNSCKISTESADPNPIVQEPIYFSKNAPIMSVTQSLNSGNFLVVAEENRQVRFMDIPTNQIVKSFELASLECSQMCRTAWAKLHASVHNSYYYACGRGLVHLDSRCKKVNECTVFPVDVSERITALGNSSNANLFYVGSDVHLRCVDVRSMGKRLPQCSVANWVHDMYYPVKYISSCLYKQVEHVGMTSSLPFDLRVCQMQTVNHRRPRHSGNLRKTIVPQTPENYLVNNCMGERNLHIEERTSACITGLVLRSLKRASDKSEAEILTSNLLGEVYSHRLGGEYNNNDAIHVVNKYYMEVERRFHTVEEATPADDNMETA